MNYVSVAAAGARDGLVRLPGRFRHLRLLPSLRHRRHRQRVRSSPTTGNTHGTTTIDGLVSISGVQIGNPVAGADIPADTVVTSVGPCVPLSGCTVTVSQAASGTTANESITFYGPDAVDDLGSRLTIDGFSLLNNGRYDLYCAPHGGGGASIKDSTFQNASLDGIHVIGGCSNARLIGDIVADSGADGILFGATEADIEGGVIEESGNAGLHLKNAGRVSVTGMHIQGNGRGAGNTGGALGAGIVVENTSTASICANHLEGNGGDLLQSSQVYFAGQDINIDLCGNVYEDENPAWSFQNKASTADTGPSYIYDADANASLTDVHLYETAHQPAVSVFSPSAQPLLSSLVVPQFTNSQIGGLTMSVTGSTTLSIKPGSVADSTNSTMIQVPATGCLIDLSQPGANGLDSGATVQPGQTYFIYIIAAPNGVGGGVATPSCMASTSPAAPAFLKAYFNHSGYFVAATGGVANAQNVAYNVSPLAGVAVGNVLGASTSDGLAAAMITAVQRRIREADFAATSSAVHDVAPVCP